MIITNLNINGFGKFVYKAISFSNGINLIYGNNEAGKTTIHTFIKSMLFGIKRKKNKNSTDVYTKYFPWDSKNSFGGTLSFIYNNREYQISREFNESNPQFEIRNVTEKGKLIKNPELFLSKVLYNLNIDTFDNTISIGQLKSSQDSSMIYELHRILANLNTTGDMSIDSNYAINLLSQKKDLLQLNLDSNATILYNKQLGNIRNIERELSSKNFENKLPNIVSKKANENKKIELNNEEIETLKQEIIEKTMLLENFGFTERTDIDSLLSNVNKVYLEYKPLMDDKKNKYKTISYATLVIIGIIMIIFSALFLVASYPDVASIFSINDTRYSMNGITNFLIKLPFHPIVLISLLLCLGLILIVGSIIFLINNFQEIKKAKELKNILSDIFNQHINDDEVSADNMLIFKKHINNMRKTAKSIDETEARILLLTKENNTLLERQSEYAETIKSQQRLQYDVEQKYNELNSLKLESEKIKETLENNDQINKEIESLNLAIETIKSLSDEIKVAFGTYLNKSISKYISIFTNGKYNSLNVDNSLNVTINYNDKIIPLSKLSTGTIDQVYLSLRLAIVDIINRDRENLPLIFDDCFAMYDNYRLESTLKFLNDRINSQQLIFTCHTRENALLDHNNINHTYINIDQ